MSSTLSFFSGYLAIEQESCICSLRDFPGTKLPRVDSFGRSQVALILKECGDGGYLQTGKLAHASICQNKQLYRDKFIQNLILRMYGKCGALQDAFKEFEGMASRNAFTWNIMLASYAQQEQLDPAMTFFLQMPERNTVSWNTMITAIAQLGQLQEALTLFQVMPEKNVVSWNAIIAACAQHGLAEEALQLFQQMKLHDVIPDKAAFASILAICGNQEAIGKGKRIHAQVLSSSFICDDVVNNALVSMYGRCGFLAGALKLFEHMYKKTTTLWNAMIEVLALNGYGRDCHLLFSEMQLQGIGPDKITYVGLLQVCTDQRSLYKGRHLHSCIMCRNFDSDSTVITALINMYGRCYSLEDANKIFYGVCKPNIVPWSAMMSVYSEYGKLQEALHLFEEIPNRNTISWNILLSAYADYENSKKAIQLFWEMQVQYVPPNKVTFIIILHSCASQQAFFEGKKLHVCIIQNGFELDVNVSSALVNMYGKCGSLFDAWRIFEIVPRSMVSWNSLIATCARHGHERDAFRLFRHMQWEGLLPDEVTFLGILSACANFCSLGHSKIVHGFIVNIGSQSDDVYNALLSTYAKCGNLECAWKIFLGMPKPSVISWNAMVVAYAQYGHQEKALGLFKEMEAQGVEPDKATFSIVLDICGDEMAFVKGKETHVKLLSSGIELDAQLGNALVSMYGKFHWMEEAHKVIDRLPIQDIMTWTSLMCSYCQRGQEKEALCLVQEIKMQKLRLDQITCISVLAACANLAALETGRLVHVWITASMFELDIALHNALLNMYAKCGTLDEVVGIFLKMPEQDVLSWTTVIAAYAQYGRATEATTLFKYMQLKGIRPDSITFVNFLCGFCHGLINDGYYYFLAMTLDYGITPREDHWNSIIDSLGRGGQLDEAESMANNLLFEPSILPWTVLLNASIIHHHA